MQIAKRLYSLAQEQNDPALMIGAYHALAVDDSTIWAISRPRDNTRCGLFRSGARASVQSPFEEVDAPAVACLSLEAILQWHFGEIPSCHATMAEAISLGERAQ